MKYLKRLPGALNKSKSQYFIVNRADQSSDIALMPRYLKDYVTEFNYLFHQIYKCASIEAVDDQNYTTFYGFGNNARKFFEIYLYYKSQYGEQALIDMNEELAKESRILKMGTFFSPETVKAGNKDYDRFALRFQIAKTGVIAVGCGLIALIIVLVIRSKKKRRKKKAEE